jgi:NAD(P)-dependent dehydrogenase (short-subunit alcohol dehydrogenase family)
MTASTRRGVAALAAGATIGAAIAAGTALLLYTGQGFLRAVGLLISSSIMAVAAGVWAGAPDDESLLPPQTRGRWLAVVLSLLAAGVFSSAWSTRAALRELAFGGALAVLLLLALPAYTVGALLSGIQAREQHGSGRDDIGGLAATALAGAAFGVLLATTILIQNLEPYGIYYGAAALLALAAMMESSAPAGTGSSGMHDHVALITGAGRAGQVGHAIASRFVDAGAHVVITDIVEEVEQLAEQLGGRVVAVRADLTSEADVQRLFDVVDKRLGRLDTLVNAAGGLTVIRSVADTTPEEWQRELQRNAETVLRASRAALPLLRTSRGAIVNFASPAGERASARLGAYSAAKAAVIALTRALALEEKEHGVRVNAIAPGMIDTRQNREDAADGTQFVTREEIADVVLFLAGDASRGISGETIHVPGATLA